MLVVDHVAEQRAVLQEGRGLGVVALRGGIRKAPAQVTESDLVVRSSLRREVEQALAMRHDLTVITHSLALMRDIAALSPRITLVGLVGDYFPQTESFLGPGVAHQARELRADTVLVSTTALRGGVLYHPDYEAAVTKRRLLEVAERRELLVDATKLTGPGLYQVAPLAQFHDVIIEAAAGEDRIAELRQHTDATFHIVGS